MKASNKAAASRLFLALLGLLGSTAITVPAYAGSVGRVSVMEVDEVRDAATISRAKAQFRSEGGGRREAGSGGSSGCSDLNIGNVDTKVGQRGPRNVVVVVEGPVVQENNCR